MAGGVGLALQGRDMPTIVPLHAFLFGEDQGRYVLTCPSDVMFALRQEATEAGVPNWYLGLTGGDALVLPDQEPLPIAELKTAHEGWLPGYMDGTSEAAEPIAA
jgi:hypothetical protein